MNVSKVNLEDLVEACFLRTDAPVGDKYLQQARPDDLERLLRFHGDEPIKDASEIYLRECVDQLLSFYSVLEIASLISFVPEVDGTGDFWGRIHRNLSMAAVREYYERKYPLLLPVLLRKRIEGDLLLKVDGSEQLTPRFLEFLSLDDRLRQDQDVRIFLRLVDDFTVKGVRFGDLLEVVGRQGEFLDRILRPPGKRDILDDSISGFRRYVEFLGTLVEMLDSVQFSPVFQSALWQYYCYWFVGMRSQLSDKIVSAATRFGSWEAIQSDEAKGASVDGFIEETRRIVDQLTSGEYGSALPNLEAANGLGAVAVPG
jgi:hypothetical protein